MAYVNPTTENRIATIELNRPERKNALIGPLADELAAAIESASTDDDVNVIVIQGAGGAFCSGLDLKEFGKDPQPDWVPEFGGKWQRVHRLLFDTPKIVVCALERYAINGGAALALAGDFLVAGDGAFLQVGEIQQGMAAPMNMVWLRLRHSESVAAHLALLGGRVHGPELVSIGVAHSSVDDDSVLGAAHELAGRMATHHPAGVHKIKRALRASGPAVDADSWFERILSLDPLGRTARPVAATDT